MAVRDSVNTTSAAPGEGTGALACFAGVTALMALVQLFCLGLSLLGFTLTPIVVWPLVAIALVSASVFGFRFIPHKPARQSEPAVRPALFSTLAVRLISAGFLLWALGVWVRLWQLAYSRPPYDWDGLYYHLPAINQWVRAGHVGWIDAIPDIPFVNVPMGVEVSSFLVHQATGTSRLVDACNLLYWPLAFGAIVVVATELGARGVWRWLAGAFLVGAPVFLSQSVSCYVDPGFSGTVMAAVAASVVLVFADERSVGRKTLLWGAALGLMAGSKGTGAPFTLVIFAVVAVLLGIVHGFGRARIWVARFCLAGAVVLAVGSYWYVRGAIKTGNPIHPVQLRIGGKVLKQGYDPRVFLTDNMPDWLAEYPPGLRLPVSWLQLDAPIHGFAPTGGMGYLWIFGCVPAMAVMVTLRWRRRHGLVARKFAALAVLTLALFAVQPSSWWARLTVWLYVLGAPCLAVVLMEAAGSRRVVLRLLAVTCLLAASGVVIWESQRTLVLELDTGKQPVPGDSGTTYVSTTEFVLPGLQASPGYDGFCAAGAVARSDWSRLGTLLGGVLAMPLGAREIQVLPAAVAEGDIEALRRAGFDWICWDGVVAGEVPPLIADAALRTFRYNPDADVDFTFLMIDEPDVGTAENLQGDRAEGSG